MQALTAKLKRLQKGESPPVGQMLLVTQVPNSARPQRPCTDLFLKRAEGMWVELKDQKAAARTLGDVWSMCGGYSKKRLQVRLVAEVLQELGLGAKNVVKRIRAWAAPGSKLGVRKRDFVKVKARSGRGAANRWAASRATCSKLWSALQKRRA